MGFRAWCHTPFGMLRGDRNGCMHEIWHAASLDNTNERIKISSQCDGGSGRERVRRKIVFWSKKRCFFQTGPPPDEHHARPLCSFSSLPKLSLSNSMLEKEISRRRARVLFVLAIIKNTVFCKVMLGFQQDVSSGPLKPGFTLAINTIKTVASKHYGEARNS